MFDIRIISNYINADSCLQVLVIDELNISDDDKKKIERGETSEIEETLTWLADNTAMTLAALSSTAILDNDVSEFALSQTGLDEMIKRTGYKAVTLPNIMRSSANIAKATSPESYNKITSDTSYKIQETITAGSSSTVPGRRPLAMLYRWIDDDDYLGGCSDDGGATFLIARSR